MWEIVLVVAIVGVALFFTGRSLVRSLKTEKGHCVGCAGCKQAGNKDSK